MAEALVAQGVGAWGIGERVRALGRRADRVGVGMAEAALFDRHGRVGCALQTLVLG